MAQHQLGRIVALTTQGGWNYGDVMISYFDDVTKSVKNERNGVTAVSGSILFVTYFFNQGKTFIQWEKDWSRNYTHYEALIDNTLYTFRPITYYPYFAIEKEDKSLDVEESEGESNEISIAFSSLTKASSSTAKDGQIVVSSTGANGTPKFALEKPDYVYGQTSGTFTNLPAGRYTIYAVDSKGYFDFITVTVGFTGNQYTPKWRVNFKDRDNADTRIDICERGIAGSPLVVSADSTPFTYSTRGETQDFEDLTLLHGQVDVNLLNSEQDQYLAIPQGDDEQFQAKVYLDLGSGLQLIFQGYINPSSFSDSPTSSGYISSFTANDRLAYISNFHFVRADTFTLGSNKNEEIRNRNSQMSAIITCLNKTNLTQGFRIACNIFETNQAQLNTTPFHQTYFNADVYIKNETPEKCDVILKHILVPYGAMLVSWNGYWYIIRQKELLNETVNYKEFDSNGDYVSTGSFDPRIQFKQPDQPNKYRWIAGVSRVFTETYRYINLIIDTVVREGGFIEPFSIDNALSIGWQNLTTFKNFTIKKGNVSFANAIVNKGTQIDRKDYWRMQIRETEKSNTYMLWNKNIDHNGNDRCVLRIKYNVQALYNPHIFNSGQGHTSPPYAIMKWRLKLGSLYLTADGQWTATPTLNEHWVTNFDKDDEFEKTFDLPTGGTTLNESLQLRLYPVSYFENQTYGSNNANMISALQGVGTTSLGDGTRRVCKVSVAAMRYYELQVTSKTADDYYIVQPNDYHGTSNNRRWVLVSEIFYYQANDLYSTTDFDYVQLDFLPGGNEPVEEITEKFLNLENNRIDKDLVVHQFDLDNTFNNDEKLFLNYTTLADGTPTELWQEVEGGSQKRLVYHQVDWVQKLTKKARMRASGTILTDIHFTPLNVLYDPDDYNRIYYPNGMNCDYRRKQHNGELTEISSDELPTNSAFDIQAFEQSAFQ